MTNLEKEYNVAIQNMKRVKEYLNEKYYLDYNCDDYNFGVDMNVSSTIYTESIDDMGSFTYGVCIEGQKDGTLKLITDVCFEGAYKQYIDNHISGMQCKQLYQLYEEAERLAKELKDHFEFIEVIG